MNSQWIKNQPGAQTAQPFMINIRYQQHHSWQGTLQRLDTGETISFRSVLELMHLIETALEKSDTDRLGNWADEPKEVETADHDQAQRRLSM